jgi:hypothetical protein
MFAAGLLSGMCSLCLSSPWVSNFSCLYMPYGFISEHLGLCCLHCSPCLPIQAAEGWFHQGIITPVVGMSWQGGVMAVHGAADPIVSSVFPQFCWALPPQGQGLSHWIQLLDLLPY